MIKKEKKNNMRFISAFCVLFLAIMLINCSEDPLHSANGSDGIPPGKVTVNSIENIAGGAIIKFTPPTDEDLLYIKGSYDDENGTEKQVIVSSFIDTLGIRIWSSWSISSRNSCC